MSATLAGARFRVPEELFAAEPPEARGLARDEVRLLVAGAGSVRHTTFTALPDLLDPGDVVVVNTSATLAAAVDGERAGGPVVVHFSTPLADGCWVVELRDATRGRVHDGWTGERIALPHGVTATLVAGYPDADRTAGGRLWRARVPVEGGVPAYLGRVGRPIAYGYVRERWPLAAYQTVFASDPGSAEMPSAGRPFSPRVLGALARRGVVVTDVTLHTGVSSLEAGETPLPERYRVPPAAARAVNAARAAGRRVVAVGTTVTRALETVARPDGTVVADAGWTELVLGPDRPARVVDGLVTGWHEPEASHLLLLDAVAGPELVQAAYAAAIERRYRWHEFGDSCLLLPDRPAPRHY